jgi:dolichyl-phosphate beta-glucosyltransferase
MKYSLVIPAYNEGERIGETLRKLIKEFGSEAQLIVVDDGSGDDTSEKAKQMGANVVRHPHNRGKGAAVRTGFIDAEGDVIGFVDADESTSAQDARKVFESIKGYDVAIAIRKGDGAQILVKQPIWRILAGDLFHHLTEALFHIGVRDTQCGCKAFKKECAKEIAKEMMSDGFEFDVEMLYLARTKGKKINLVPIVWKHADKSKLSVTRHAPKMLLGLIGLRMKYLRGRR